MAKLPTAFKYRDGWRGQVTLKNGQRPHADFEKQAEANQWITDQLANRNSENEPELGGPKEATLAQALFHYAGMYTISKGGRTAELDRINHYLLGAGMKPQKFAQVEDKLTMIAKPIKALPSAFKAHQHERMEKRVETYKLIVSLANRRASTLTTADFRKLMVCMKTEGLSDSSIQKEIAMLKHLFNMAAKEWAWKGFENPCVGLKLKGSNTRFVVVTAQQQQDLRAALAECDNPYFWPMVEVSVETTLRKGSLLAMTRSNVDLEGRVAVLPSKTGTVSIPLSLKAVHILRDMPQHESGRYFPMSGNAVDMAWDGVRRKINMLELQFKDLRHVGATALARAGANSHQLQKVLGHKSSRQAEIYVNLAGADTLEFLDRIAPTQAVYQVPVPALGSGEDLLKRNRAKRLTDAFVTKVKELQCSANAAGASQEAGASEPQDAAAQFSASRAQDEPAVAQAGNSEGAATSSAALQAAAPTPASLPIVDPVAALKSSAPHRPVPDVVLPAADLPHVDTTILEGAQATGTTDAIGTKRIACATANLGANVVQVNFRRAR